METVGSVKYNKNTMSLEKNEEILLAYSLRRSIINRCQKDLNVPISKEGGVAMNPIINRLYSIEQSATRLEQDIDQQKENLRKKYADKQAQFNEELRQKTAAELAQIREASRRGQEEKTQQLHEEHQLELQRLETEYKQKQEEIVESIVANIIKG